MHQRLAYRPMFGGIFSVETPSSSGSSLCRVDIKLSSTAVVYLMRTSDYRLTAARRLISLALKQVCSAGRLDTHVSRVALFGSRDELSHPSPAPLSSCSHLSGTSAIGLQSVQLRLGTIFSHRNPKMCFEAKEDFIFSFFSVGINQWQVVENLKTRWYMIRLAPCLPCLN